MASARSGRFVVLEGIDGAGTTTHVARLADRLRAAGGPPVRSTREPSDGPIGSLVRQVLSGRIVEFVRLVRANHFRVGVQEARPVNP